MLIMVPPPSSNRPALLINHPIRMLKMFNLPRGHRLREILTPLPFYKHHTVSHSGINLIQNSTPFRYVYGRLDKSYRRIHVADIDTVWASMGRFGNSCGFNVPALDLFHETISLEGHERGTVVVMVVGEEKD